MWIAFAAIGLQQAAVWGSPRASRISIPYLGGLILGVASMLVAYMQFGTIEMALSSASPVSRSTVSSATC